MINKRQKVTVKRIIFYCLNFFKKTYIVSHTNQSPNRTEIIEHAVLNIPQDQLEYLKYQKLFPYFDEAVYKEGKIVISYFSDVFVDLDNGIGLSENLEIIQETKKYPTIKNATYLSKISNYTEINDEYVIVINGALNAQYFHIWFDSLIKLYYLNQLENKPVIVLWDKTPQIYKDVIYSFNDIFKINEVTTRFIKVKNYGIIKNLYWAKHAPYFSPKIRDFLAAKLVKQQYEFPKKVYIKRKTRPIINAEEIEKIFTEKGFEMIYLEDLNIFEQAELFHNADVVAGLHGAGFTNLIFASPKLKIIELQNFAIVTTYYFISKQLDLDYHYVLPNEYDYDAIHNPYSENKLFYKQKLTDVSFDGNKVKQVLEKILVPE